MKSREELDIEQFKIKFDIERILKVLKEYKLGMIPIANIKIKVDDIKKYLGL
jgi:hypothetical protein